MKTSKYRIRTLELNDGSEKHYPETTKSFLFPVWMQIVLINGDIATIDNLDYFCKSKEEAQDLIKLHIKKEILFHSKEVNNVTITPYIPEYNVTEIELPRAQKRGYEHPEKFAIQ